MQLGPVRFAVDAKHQSAERPFEHRLVIRETGFARANTEEEPRIQELYGALAADETRNQLILRDVTQALQEGRSPLVLTERKDHLQYFASRLRKFGRHIVVLRGGMSEKERRDAGAELASIAASEQRIVFATGRYIGEGFDDARLDTLFLTLPVSWKGTLVQYAGRLHRLHPGKTEVRIFDYVDRDVPMLQRMFEKRLRGYRAIGYAELGPVVGQAQLPGGTVGGEATADASVEPPKRDQIPRPMRGRETTARLRKARLEELIEEATVDCYNQSEEVTGLLTILEHNLELPFDSVFLNLPVTVERVDLNQAEQIVAVCGRGRARQRIHIVDLPLPSPPPAGSEWIEAYRYWLGR